MYIYFDSYTLWSACKIQHEYNWDKWIIEVLAILVEYNKIYEKQMRTKEKQRNLKQHNAMLKTIVGGK